MGEPSNISIAAINSHVSRRQYLVSFSQADESKFSTRESFGEVLEAVFNEGISIAKVDLIRRGVPEWRFSLSLGMEAYKLQKTTGIQK